MACLQNSLPFPVYFLIQYRYYDLRWMTVGFYFFNNSFFIISSIDTNSDYSNQSLSVETTTNLQIIAVLFVILHHLSQILRDYPDSFLSSRLIIAGRLAVGLFFFVSGYGLIKQFKQKGKSYLDTFFKKKGMSILLPFLLAMIVYFVYRNLIGELNFSAAMYSLVNGNPFVGNG